MTYPQGDPPLSGDERGSLLVVFLLGCAAGGGLALTLGILILRATV
jgi:hypothetical protein